MKKQHARTLAALFARPTSANIRWTEIEALLLFLGATRSEREGSRIAFVWNHQVQVFHRPHPSPHTDKGAVASVRKWLESNGVTPMINTIDINGHIAVVRLDPELKMFRGEFLGLNGGADFYADSMSTLIHEGKRSLATFLQVCKENRVEPFRKFSGKFQVRLPTALHAQAALVAAARGLSLNQFVAEAIEHETEAAD